MLFGNQRKFKAFFDDFNLHAKTEDPLLEVYSTVLKLCDQRDLVLTTENGSSFRSAVHRCGLLIDWECYRMDRRQIFAIEKK